MVSSVDHQQLDTDSPTVPKMDDNVDKVLSNAVAGAMAKLSLEPTRTNGHLQQDLLSFEMLNMHDRSVARASHTATPNNTPLGEYLLSFISQIYINIYYAYNWKLSFVQNILCFLKAFLKAVFSSH